ncbi:NOP5/NOP56 family protein [Halocatena halophila]|uniref:NOP5/NOP56 family protein n=1 Tax=Halocatena halophila TaxID=2814576 RepID=UPI002ED6B788
MNADRGNDRGWFSSVTPGDPETYVGAIADGSATEPADWPARAIESGVVPDQSTYYELLHAATQATARAQVRRRERTDDQRLIHCIRAMDDTERVANELAERVSAWSSTTDTSVSGIDGARELLSRSPTRTDDAIAAATDEQLVSLAEQVVALDDQATALRETIEKSMPTVAPNLSMVAGPVLGARLIALAGGLEALAKQPSGTIQVLGAEDALFAHLAGRGSSPKHGVIFVHEYVSGTEPSQRGSAARALAGKLAIAARIDHYAGDRRPSLQAELDERIATIQSRGDGNE